MSESSPDTADSTAVADDTGSVDSGSSETAPADPCATKLWDVLETSSAPITIGGDALRFDGRPPRTEHQVQVTQPLTGDFDATIQIDSLKTTGTCSLWFFVASKPVPERVGRVSMDLTSDGKSYALGTSKGTDRTFKAASSAATLRLQRVGDQLLIEGTSGMATASTTMAFVTAPLVIGIMANCQDLSGTLTARVQSFTVTGGGDAKPDEFTCDSLKK